MPCCILYVCWYLACIQYSSKPSEDAKENCISNYQTGEFNSENVLKIAENKGLTRLDIQEAANNIIEATNKKRKRDSDMLRDFKKTAEYQVSCDILITTVRLNLKDLYIYQHAHILLWIHLTVNCISFITWMGRGKFWYLHVFIVSKFVSLPHSNNTITFTHLIFIILLFFCSALYDTSRNATPYSQGLWTARKINGRQDAGADGMSGEDRKAGRGARRIQEGPSASLSWH